MYLFFVSQALAKLPAVTFSDPGESSISWAEIEQAVWHGCSKVTTTTDAARRMVYTSDQAENIEFVILYTMSDGTTAFGKDLDQRYGDSLSERSNQNIITQIGQINGRLFQAARNLEQRIEASRRTANELTEGLPEGELRRRARRYAAFVCAQDRLLTLRAMALASQVGCQAMEDLRRIETELATKLGQPIP